MDKQKSRHAELVSASQSRTPDRNKQNVNANEILNSEDCRVPQSLMLQDDVGGNNSNSNAKKRGSFRLLFTVHRLPLTPHFSLLTPNFQRYTGFTLAEVLIVLGVIGIIAMMTIPTLINNMQEATTITALKKAYSTLSQAYTMAVQENGTPDTWGLNDSDAAGSAVIILNTFAKYLNIAKNCSNNTACFSNTTYYNLNRDVEYDNINEQSKLAKAILSDGSYILFDFKSADCSKSRGASQILSNVCATVSIDINGSQKPNVIGKDYFCFIISKYGIIPHGAPDDTIFPFGSSCNLNSTGWGCTAWVIYNENMDYLKCSDLSWNSKHKCGG
jgi:prepilin-type N-terminal cleavage/methylation domain-containing protein